MDLCEGVKKTVALCVPDSLRIWRNKRRHRDVIRDGVWLGRQVKKTNRIGGNGDLFDERLSCIGKSNLQEWKTLPVDTMRREKTIDAVVERYGFTFETMLVIRNPYGRTPLSARLFFDTREACYVAYTVKGKTRECDFSYETKKRRQRHCIPVFGMYADTRNRVEIRLLNERRETVARKRLIIQTPPIPDKFDDMVSPILQDEPTTLPFIMVTGGINGSTYAFDKEGEIRYYLSRRPRQYGIYPMSDGGFLFPVREINQPTYINSHANVVHEMDLLGRVKETCYIPGGTHHWMTEIPGMDGRMVLAAASSMKERMEDMVICYDRDEGKIVRTYDLGQCFPKQYQNRCDWAHVNCISCDSSHSMIVSLRNLHTVVKMDLESGEIVWVMAHPKQYQGTVLEKKVLRPQGEEFHYFFQQHAAEPVHTEGGWDCPNKDILEVMLFDNHCVTKRKAPWHDGKEMSYVCFYRISEADMTVETQRVFPCMVSPTRSNAWFDGKNRRVFVMAGASDTENEKAQISEWDFDTGKKLNEYHIRQGFFRAFPFEIQDKQLESQSRMSYPYRKGQLERPVSSADLPQEILPWSQKPKEMGFDFAYMDNLILVRARDHVIEKIYFWGESVWERDFLDTSQKSEIFAQKSYYVAVPADSLPYGTYRIIIQAGGKKYDSGREFEVRAV